MYTKAYKYSQNHSIFPKKDDTQKHAIIPIVFARAYLYTDFSYFKKKTKYIVF